MAGRVDCSKLWEIVAELEKTEAKLEGTIEECTWNADNPRDLYAVVMNTIMQLEEEKKNPTKQINKFRAWLNKQEDDFDPTYYGPGTRNMPWDRREGRNSSSSALNVALPPDEVPPWHARTG